MFFGSSDPVRGGGGRRLRQSYFWVQIDFENERLSLPFGRGINKIIMGAELSVVGLSEISTKYSTLSTQALGELREQQPEDKELEDEIRRRILIKEEEIRRKYAGISD